MTTKLMLLNFVGNIADKTYWSKTNTNIYIIAHIFIYLFVYAAKGYIVSNYVASSYTAINYIAVGYTTSSYRASE